MTPVQTSANSSVMPRALIIGAGPEALMGIEPMLGANRFRVDFLEQDSTRISQSGNAVPILSCCALRRTMTKRVRYCRCCNSIRRLGGCRS